MKKFLCLFICLVAVCTTLTRADIPHAISYQGVLSSTNGTLVPDGEYAITLNIYEDVDATTPIFTEMHRAVVIKGIFNVLIGSTHEFPESMSFDRAYFLGVSINGTDEMRPRTPLTATPYALRAQSAARADIANALSPNAKGAVTSINKTQGDVQVVAGAGIEVKEVGNQIIISDVQRTIDSKGNAIQAVPSQLSFSGDVTGNVNTSSSPWYLTIPPQKITTDKLAPGAVTSDKLAAGALGTSTIANGAVTTAKLADGSVTTAKLANGAVVNAKVTDNTLTLSKLSTSGANAGEVPTFDGSSLVWSAPGVNGTAGGDLTGSYPNPSIADDAVTTAKILDGTITNGDIAAAAGIPYSKLTLTNSIQNIDIVANAITTSKVANGTVTTSKLADSAVSGLKLLTSAVQTAHVANGAITPTKMSSTGASSGDVLTYNGSAVVWTAPSGSAGAAGGDLSGSYPNPVVANDAITSGKILDGTIVNADVSPAAAIAYSKLSLTNSIQNSDIVANAITTSKVANGTVTTSKMADSAISGLKLLTSAVNTAHIADDAITSAKIQDGSIVNADVSGTAAIAYSKLALTNSIQNGDIVANAITTSKVANGTVTTSKMADSAISGLKLLTYAVNTAHIADGAVTLAKVNTSGAASGNVLTYNGSSVTWAAPSGSGGSAGGDLSGTYPNPVIANDAITSAKILDGTIVNADISPTAAIAYSKLSLTNSIVNGDVQANCITTSKVANGTVTTSKMADSAISGLKLLTFAVTNRHIADGAVTTAKLSGTGGSAGDVLMYNGSTVNWTNPYTTGRVTAAASTTQTITQSAVGASNTIIVTIEGPTAATVRISARSVGNSFDITTSPALTTSDVINYIVMP